MTHRSESHTDELSRVHQQALTKEARPSRMRGRWQPETDVGEHEQEAGAATGNGEHQARDRDGERGVLPPEGPWPPERGTAELRVLLRDARDVALEQAGAHVVPDAAFFGVVVH